MPETDSRQRLGLLHRFPGQRHRALERGRVVEQILNQTQEELSLVAARFTRVHAERRLTLMSTLMLFVIFRATTLILFCSQQEEMFLNRASGDANCSAASRYLVCLQSVSRLSLQGDAQLSDVDLQTSGEVLQPEREQG